MKTLTLLPALLAFVVVTANADEFRALEDAKFPEWNTRTYEPSGPLVGRAFYDIPADAKTTVRVYPDDTSPVHWYYLPPRPRVPLEVINGTTVPQILLLKYSLNEGGQITQGGLLNFAATLGLTADQQAQVEAGIKEKTGVDKVFLGMVNITKANSTILAGRKDGIVDYVLGEGPAPRHPGADAVFSMPLTKTGVALFEELLNGTAGLGVNIVYEYEAYTPHIDVTVTGNYRGIAKLHAESSEFRAKVGGWFWSASYSRSTEEISRIMQEKAVCTIKWKEYPDTTTESGKQLRDFVEGTIFTRIFDEIMKTSVPEIPLEAPKAQAPNGHGFYNVGYSVATKDISVITEKELVFHYQGRVKMRIQDIPIGAFISASSISPEARPLVFRQIKPDEYFNALYVNSSASVNPKAYSLRKLTFHYSSDLPNMQAIDRSFVPAGDDLERLANSDPNPWTIPYALQNKYKVGYTTSFNVRVNEQPVTVEGNYVELPKGGYSDVTYANDKSGLSAAELDFSSMVFADEHYMNAPLLLRVTVAHEKNTYAFTIRKEQKNATVMLPFTADNKPISLKIQGLKWVVGGPNTETRELTVKNLRDEGLFYFVENHDFKKIP